jgi:RNase P/RNase MRP subunit p30
MDIVYTQPLKELLQITTYFKEQVIVLVENEKDEKVAKQNGFTPCYLVSDTTKDIQKLYSKKKAVLGGSIKANEFATKIKADFLISPSNTKQFFDLGLAQKLADNGTIVVLMFGELMKKNSFERHQYWKNFLEVVKYCKLKKVNFIVASGCNDPLHIRPRKVRVALAEILGLTNDLAEKYLSEEIK